MASRKPTTTQFVKQRPVLLKDYLMDDFSSCSSNGFKSFPRRNCCTTTVRFLLDIDLKTSSQPSFHNPNKIKINHQNPQLLRRSRSRAAAACDAVINAVKSFPFHSVKSSSSPSVGKGMLLLPRSLSRRLRRKSFWKRQSKKEKREETDFGRWKSFREYLMEKPATADQTTTTASTAITVPRLSISSRSSESKSDSNCNSNCNSWGESEFTMSSQSSSGKEVVAEVKTTSLVKNKVSERVGVEVAEDSVSIERPTTATCSPQNAKEWVNNRNEIQEKEQFSPVSVLDCPFEDEDDQTSSPFSFSFACLQGTQQKLKKKLRRFENLETQLEPVDLEKRIDATMWDSEVEDEAPASSMLAANPGDEIREPEEKLVLDLCRERVVEDSDENVVMQEVMKVAEDWINGESQELLLGWEVEEGRSVYVSDMEKYCGNWREMDCEKHEVGMELEVEVWNSLLKDLLLDLLI